MFIVGVQTYSVSTVQCCDRFELGRRDILVERYLNPNSGVPIVNLTFITPTTTLFRLYKQNFCLHQTGLINTKVATGV